jgi:orotidine-5'-phosphate decarboxylase
MAVEAFADRLAAAVAAVGAPVAVGLDPHLERFPAPLRARFEGRSGAAGRAAAADAIVSFHASVLPVLAGRVAAVKPQLAFFEALGSAGWAALEQTCALARAHGLLVIADGKRGDIASTAAAYAHAILDPAGPLGADALTLNAWMGVDTLLPHAEVCRAHGRGIFVLARTTNPGSAALQLHGAPAAAHHLAALLRPLHDELCGRSGTSGLGLVVGASLTEDARALRALLPGAWFLAPGVGAQGGSLRDALAGRRGDGLGCLPVSSRAVLFPSAPDPAYDADPAAWVLARVEALRAAAAAALSPPAG